MKTTGKFLLDRSILRYFTKPFKCEMAWIWLISQAEFTGEHKGKVFFSSITDLSKTWGVNKSTGSRWLKDWVLEERITSPTTVQHLCNTCATQPATQRMEVTLLNYRVKQTLKNDCATTVQHLCNDRATPPLISALRTNKLINEEEEEKKQGSSTPAPTKPKKKAATKSPKTGGTKEQVEAAIDALDLPKFEKKYTAVNVPEEHRRFRIHFLAKNDAKTGKPNWRKWSDWNLAFHEWCRNSQKWNSTKSTKSALDRFREISGHDPL
jgi:hypothetical protein